MRRQCIASVRMRDGRRGAHTGLITLLLLLVFHSACQAQPNLPRPVGPTAGAAVVPSGVPVNPTAGATAPQAAAKPAVPGVPPATPGAIAPNTPLQPAGNVPTQPAAATPGGAATVPGVPPANAALVQPGAAVVPNQQPKPPGTPPGVPGSSSSIVNPAAGVVNPATGIVNPAAGVINPASPPATPGGVPGVNPAIKPNTPLGPVGLTPSPAPGVGGVFGPAFNPMAMQMGPGILAPSPAVAAVVGSSPAVGATSTGAAQPTEVIDSPVGVGTISINAAGTTVRSAYTWTVNKRFSSQAKSLALTLATGTGTATATYELTVTKSLATQVVSVAGTFPITGTGTFGTPVLTFAPAPAATPTGSVSCVPANTAPSTCTFSQSWSDNSITAAAGGTLTVTVGAATASAPYNFAGVTGGTTGNCATVTDNFVITPSGSVTGSNMQMSGNYPPAGLQICDIGDKLYTYSVTFSNMGATLCATTITAVNTVTVTPVDGGTPVSDTTTATVTVTGCTGTDTSSAAGTSSVITSAAGAPSLSGASAVTVSGLQTVIVNTYTWTIENTGGGYSLTTSPDQELTIPFTTTATQTLTSSQGWVSGSVSISNNAVAAIAITGFSIDLGGGATSQPLGQCQSTSLAVGASTSCGFNVSAPNAPAAGSVTAKIDYTVSGSLDSRTETMSSTAAPYSFTSAQTYDLGAQASLYLTLDATSLSSITGAWSSVQCTNPAGCNTGNSLLRIQPPDSAPPQSAPGITISQTTIYNYNVVVNKLYTCVDSRTLTNTATLTPYGGTAQIRAATATFSVIGCNVLPTVELSNIQTFAAVTWAWSMTKTANPTQYQLPVGSGGSAQYQVQLTRTQSTANYAMAGTLTIINPAKFPMYISSVTLMSTTGSFGALPPACLGGSNVAGSTISGMTGGGAIPFGRRRLLLTARRLYQWATGNTMAGVPFYNPNALVTPYGTTAPTGSFMIQAGAQIQCQFNISAGTGSAPQGLVYAQATTTSTYVTATGNTAISQNVPVDFTAPTQQWDIGGCVSFSDNAVTQGSAGTWAPQLGGLPQQQRICESRNFPYTADISPVPMTGATCNQPITITNTANAVPDGGTTTAQASASIQVLATGCTAPSPVPGLQQTQQVVAPQPIDTINGRPLSSDTLVASVQQPVRVAAVGSFEWATAVTSDVDAAGRFSVAFGASRAVQYTVSARRKSAFTFYVTGTIAVSNKNTQAVSATSVSAQLPAGYVLAACQGGRFPISIPAGGSVLCAFNATLTDAVGSQGSVTAVVASTFGTSTSAASVPYSLDAPATSPGACAVLSDSLSARPTLPASSVTVTGNKPLSDKAQPVCEDTSYNFTARFGPFGEADCNMYTVSAEAAATPSDSPRSGATARNTLQLYVDGCPATAQSVNTVSVVVSPPVGRSIPSVKWSADTQAEWLTTLKYTDNRTLAYNVSWSRADATTSRMSGTVVVSNPTSAAVTIKLVALRPEFGGGSSGPGSAGDAASLDATCKETTLAPGASTNCTYTGTVSGGGPGTVVADVQLTSGRTLSSAPTPINLPSRTSKTGVSTSSTTSGCADIVTGLFLSPAMVQANRTLSNTPQQLRACTGGSQQVSVTVGPFSEESCGSYTVVSTTRVRPPADSGQLPFASLGVAKLVITGCPLSETPKPETQIAEGFNASSLVRFPWRVSSSSDVTDPLSLRQGETQDVSVSVEITRDPGQRSLALQGYVQVAAQGTRNLTITAVQAGALRRLGELQVVNATCPSDSLDSDGLIVVPPRPAKLLCSFQIADLPPMDGTITPLVYATEGSSSPLPAMPAIYRIANAPRVPVGECAVLGASRSLREEGASAAVEGQPASKAASALPATPVCGDFSTTFDMTFGPFGPSQCGRYEFSGSVTATPVAQQGGAGDRDLAAEPLRPARGDLRFAVVVAGCQRNTRASGQKAAMGAVAPQQSSKAPRGL